MAVYKDSFSKIEPHDVKCKCGAQMRLIKNKTSDNLFYGCTTWPECDFTTGAHDDGTPRGLHADGETRELRVRLRQLLNYYYGADKNGAYAAGDFLRNMCGTAKLDEVNKDEARKIIARLER